jgi:hypothetical protein
VSNRRKTRAVPPCADCGTPTVKRGRPSEWYMVQDSVWEAAGMPATPDLKSYLCIGCLEVRLGRRLTPADFTAAGANDPAQSWMTPRLLDRLGLLCAS